MSSVATFTLSLELTRYVFGIRLAIQGDKTRTRTGGGISTLDSGFLLEQMINLCLRISAVQQNLRCVGAYVSCGLTHPERRGGIADWRTDSRDRTHVRVIHLLEQAHVFDMRISGQILECDGGLSLQSPIDGFGEMERARKGRSS